eukprot:TRINITY_DN3018_c0_g1_i2.p1 TRINITY_DN3018_c0_g1~~TRINITY_DN3018_c0_g1_i2.p1  ORF type:complete len:1067 (-),score=139.23 TRINITY_DN3018_c0_g1_i2:1111-4311(-)
MESSATQLDERTMHALSRQIGTFGLEGQVKITSAKVFVTGMGPLGIEVAKNICLAGVNALTIHDTTTTSAADLGGNFYLSESSLGFNRAEQTLPALRNLNPSVSVTLAAAVPLCENLGLLEGFNVVVATDIPLTEQQRLNDFCRANKIKFVSGIVHGVFCSAFVDFGAAFETSDANGEPVKEVMLQHIESGPQGIVSTVRQDPSRPDSHIRHDFDDGDFVVFRDCPVMAEFERSGNSRAIKITQKGFGSEEEELFAHEISVINSHEFSIGDTTTMAPYTPGATSQQVKVRVPVEFQTLGDAILNPGEFCDVDMFKTATQYPPLLLHLGFQALSAFEVANGQLPRVWDHCDAAKVVEIAHELAKQEGTAVHGFELGRERELVLQLLAFTARACLPPLAAFLGGFLAQEVLKGIMHKYTPLQQFMYLGAEEVIDMSLVEAENYAEFQPQGNRLDHIVACVGQKLSAQLQALRVFMVGAGAIGCELLKNLAMLGVATSADGMVTLTDPDTIEASNLNRQFLFKLPNIGQLKSEVAAHAATVMNPEFQTTVYADKVCPDTESKYNDDFIGNCDIVLNALDNVKARTYIDSRAVANHCPLIDSGTTGAKGHVQVVVPMFTESYGSMQDPPDDSFPECTIHSFPSEIAHTIQWARQMFLSQYCEGPTAIAKLFDGDFVSNVKADQSSGQLQLLKQIAELWARRPTNFDDCIRLGRVAYEKSFVHMILQLLVDKPTDLMVGEPPTPFWTLPRRLPSALPFDPSDMDCLRFVQACAHLNAKMFGLSVECVDLAHIAKVAMDTEVPEFIAAGGLEFEHDQSLSEEERQKLRDAAVNVSDFDTQMSLIECHLKAEETLELTSDELEKDDDSNFHVALITAASNLRARNYGIPPRDFFYTKMVAGRIIPAIATTTSVVSALVCVEMLKIVAGAKVEKMKNAFLNLALPFMSLAEPYRAEETSICNGAVTFTMWDIWEVCLGPAISLSQLIEHFRENYRGLEVTAIFHKGGTVYMSTMPTHASRLKKRVCDLPSIKVKPDKVKYVDLYVSFKDPNLAPLDSQDSVVAVVTPTVRVKFS